MTKEVIVNRKHKDRLFQRLFNGEENKENLLSLYNAVNNTHYSDLSALEITTLEDAIYLGMKNDVSFLIESTMNLYEHQSTFCPNMPLRGLIYLTKLYAGYVDKSDLNVYGKRKIGLPMPRYIVFYNGEDTMPDSMKLHLSDMFEPAEKVSPEDFQWTATMLNINVGHNKKLMEQCKILYEYAVLMDKIRLYKKELPLSEAVDKAINQCIAQNILEKFLRKHRAEVKDLILTEYDEEKTMKAFYEDGRTEGREEGIRAFIEDNLEEGISKERIIEKLKTKFNLTEEKAEEYFCKAKK